MSLTFRSICAVTAFFLGFGVGLALMPVPPRWQALILHMPNSGNGIVTGVVKTFETQQDCKIWLVSEMKELQKMSSRWSQYESIGHCNGR